MKRRLPYPLLSLGLWVMWLLLNGSLAPLHIGFGALLGLGGALALAELQAPEGRVRRAGSIAALAWLVLLDIVRSNIAVARLVVFQRARRRVAGFIAMPVEVRHPGALAVMACILTATPGTSWARFDARRRVLYIHVFDLIDEREWMERFKERYERRLMEIFE